MTSHLLTLKSNDPDELPEAYRIGWVPFAGTKIFLDSHPLIPRTETEWWVERAITEIKKKSAPHVLDLFAGSGCVGVAVLKHVSDARVDFGELEQKHFATIEKNCTTNCGEPRRSRVFKTDVWSSITDTYDFILANPPYLSKSRLGRIEPSVLAHEPPEALFADADGFRFIAEVLAGLPERLRVGGQCWIEHEPEHTALIAAGAEALDLTVTTYQDQYKVERYSVILKP